MPFFDDFLNFTNSFASDDQWSLDPYANGEDNLLSVGAFGHIFTISNEELKRRVEQNKDMQGFLNRFK